MTDEAYCGWALVEQMGFRKTVGKVREVEMYGAKMLQIDIPVGGTIDGEFTTRFAGGQSIYQVTPLSEDVAKTHVEKANDPRPVRPLDFRIEDWRVPDGDPNVTTSSGGDLDDDVPF